MNKSSEIINLVWKDIFFISLVQSLLVLSIIKEINKVSISTYLINFIYKNKMKYNNQLFVKFYKLISILAIIIC